MFLELNRVKNDIGVLKNQRENSSDKFGQRN